MNKQVYIRLEKKKRSHNCVDVHGHEVLDFLTVLTAYKIMDVNDQCPVEEPLE